MHAFIHSYQTYLRRADYEILSLQMNDGKKSAQCRPPRESSRPRKVARSLSQVTPDIILNSGLLARQRTSLGLGWVYRHVTERQGGSSFEKAESSGGRDGHVWEGGQVRWPLALSYTWFVTHFRHVYGKWRMSKLDPYFPIKDCISWEISALIMLQRPVW